MDDNKLARAKEVYATLCAAIEARGWTFQKQEDKLIVYFGVSGDDLPMRFIMVVDPQIQLVRLLSPMTFGYPEEKRIEGAIGTSAVNFLLADGSFDISLRSGSSWFRLTASFKESTVGEGLFQHMISYACTAVDTFNDRFEALANGTMSLEQFLESVQPK